MELDAIKDEIAKKEVHELEELANYIDNRLNIIYEARERSGN